MKISKTFHSPPRAGGVRQNQFWWALLQTETIIFDFLDLYPEAQGGLVIILAQFLMGPVWLYQGYPWLWQHPSLIKRDYFSDSLGSYSCQCDRQYVQAGPGQEL